MQLRATRMQLTSTYGPGKFLNIGYVLALRPQHLVPFVVSRAHVAQAITDSFLATTPAGTVSWPYLQAQQFSPRARALLRARNARVGAPANDTAGGPADKFEVTALVFESAVASAIASKRVRT